MCLGYEDCGDGGEDRNAGGEGGEGGDWVPRRDVCLTRLSRGLRAVLSVSLSRCDLGAP